MPPLHSQKVVLGTSIFGLKEVRANLGKNDHTFNIFLCYMMAYIDIYSEKETTVNSFESKVREEMDKEQGSHSKRNGFFNDFMRIFIVIL